MRHNPNMPKLATSDLMEMQLLLMGIWNFNQADGLTSSFSSATQIPNDIRPFSYDRVLDIFEKNLEANPEGLKTDDCPPELLNKLKNCFAKLGMEDVLSDGVFDNKEYIMVGAARGNQELRDHPEKYTNLSQEQYQAAQKWIEKHGVDDPDGSIARGIAVNIERLTQQANQGLGFNPDGSQLQQQAVPTLMGKISTASVAVVIP